MRTIPQKYPRIIKLLKRQFILCDSEAVCCIRDYKNGLKLSCEAISWCGRTTKEALEMAISIRHF